MNESTDEENADLQLQGKRYAKAKAEPAYRF